MQSICILKTIIIKMLWFLIDNIFVLFGETIIQQTAGIPIGTNILHPFVLAEVYFYYSYEVDIIRILLPK